MASGGEPEEECDRLIHVLQAQLDNLLQGQDGIRSSCDFTEQALSHGGEAEVLLVKKQMSERLAELAAQELPLRPGENDQLDCRLETEAVKKSIHNLGSVVTTNAVASETVATGEGLRHCVAGVPTSITVTTKVNAAHRFTMYCGATQV